MDSYSYYTERVQHYNQKCKELLGYYLALLDPWWLEGFYEYLDMATKYKAFADKYAPQDAE